MQKVAELGTNYDKWDALSKPTTNAIMMPIWLLHILLICQKLEAYHLVTFKVKTNYHGPLDPRLAGREDLGVKTVDKIITVNGH